MYQFTDGGLRNVWLGNGYEERQTKYGKAVSFHDLDGLMAAICNALSEKRSKLTGAEFRYLRSNMGLSQKSLGKLFGYTEQAVAKWEKSGKVPKSADALIRVVYAGKHKSEAKIGTLIETLNAIDWAANTRIIVSESRNKWTSKVVLEDEESDEVTETA